MILCFGFVLELSPGTLTSPAYLLWITSATPVDLLFDSLPPAYFFVFACLCQRICALRLHVNLCIPVLLFLLSPSWACRSQIQYLLQHVPTHRFVGPKILRRAGADVGRFPVPGRMILVSWNFSQVRRSQIFVTSLGLRNLIEKAWNMLMENVDFRIRQVAHGFHERHALSATSARFESRHCHGKSCSTHTHRRLIRILVMAKWSFDQTGVWKSESQMWKEFRRC